MKYFYHVVAHGDWHIDRFFWRVGAPFVSGSVAFAATLLIRANVLPIIDRTRFDLPAGVMGVSFLLGYFSDLAIGAMSNLAQRLFGRKDREERDISVQIQSDDPMNGPSQSSVLPAD